jgi:NitT/TauT family transport system permease protein
MLEQTYPSRETLRRLPAGLADVAVLLGTLALLYLLARVGAGTVVPFVPPRIVPGISLDPANLPYYTARSTLRMFIALGCSFVFALVYGYAAARSRKAERLLIPLLDVLQSVPVLGFLSVTVTGFVALFRGSLLGLEAASIFAIFTAQAWNMTFAFYHSLRTLPRELDEASALYRLPRWQRFTRLEVPAAVIPLVWNAMMSFGGGWFFLAASESISVLNRTYTLPGIGSYVATAVQRQDLRALLAALVTMVVTILVIDQLFWRPLVAWADKFRLEQSAAAAAPRSWVLTLLRTARLPRLASQLGAPAREGIDRVLSGLGPPPAASQAERSAGRWGDRLYNAVLIVVIAGLTVWLVDYVVRGVGLGEVWHAALLGLATFTRVLILLVFSTVVWVPIGVAIGFNPRLARLAQPIVQLLASFPANFLFPFATLAFIRLGISLNWGSILLMALGAQWYILFNTIAGAQSIPNELREMAANMRLRGWHRWREVIIPGIFPAWVTGAITAAGGAWNASIVSEVVSWGNTTLTATGLGAYVAQATATGDWPRIALGVGMMSIYVVGLNWLVWRRLYALAETRYRLA